MQPLDYDCFAIGLPYKTVYFGMPLFAINYNLRTCSFCR